MREWPGQGRSLETPGLCSMHVAVPGYDTCAKIQTRKKQAFSAYRRHFRSCVPQGQTSIKTIVAAMGAQDFRKR